jgi:hypothetical protein
MDNLSSHRTTDVLLFVLAHPRWEMVFQPKYAAYLNLIEPWWKILRSLALAGRRFQRLGRDHRRRSTAPQSTGTPTAIPLSGATPSASAATATRHRPRAESRITYRMNHLVEFYASPNKSGNGSRPKQVGDKARFTIYPDVGHASWTETYNNLALFKWLWNHKR